MRCLESGRGSELSHDGSVDRASARTSLAISMTAASVPVVSQSMTRTVMHSLPVSGQLSEGPAAASTRQKADTPHQWFGADDREARAPVR